MAYTCKLSTLATQGISTHMLGRLDQMVQAGIVHSPQQGRANGAVRLSGRLLRHLSWSLLVKSEPYPTNRREGGKVYTDTPTLYGRIAVPLPNSGGI